MVASQNILIKIETSKAHKVSRDSLLPISALYQLGKVSEYPIGRIIKVKHTSGYYVFEDHNRLIIVDEKGNLIGDSLDHYGKQDGGYQSIQEFEIQGDSLVYLFDPRSRKIVIYDFDFKFIMEKSIPDDLNIPISDIDIIENKMIMMEQGKRANKSQYTFTRIDMNRNQIEVQEILNLPPGILPRFHTDPIKRVGTQLLFKTTYCSDIIYSLLPDKMKLIPIRKITFNSQPAFSDIFEENPDPKYHSDHYEIVINYDENNDYIIFTSMKKINELEYEFSLFVWDKDVQILYKSPLEKYFVNIQCFGITDDNMVFSLIDPEALLMFKDKYPRKAGRTSGLESVELNDNSYLIYFSINKYKN